ncbi:DBP-2 [Artaxa digramma nucleopolyhedrovirus]|uniref:DBP-2 n=1 Tax=Artaxa digramma nucleopolyhedrovirus TaxID=3070910 RepID=A0AAE6UZM4_9ABAC|nr:DBP-2 [Euproctis digramma nucleopolyhedrovirus]QHB21715.1 DBP-2 [Artaxa digramma nucleopolyhedrovirus]
MSSNVHYHYYECDDDDDDGGNNIDKKKEEEELCVMLPQQFSLNDKMSWQDKLLTKLTGAPSIMSCVSFNNKFDECLAPIVNCVPFDDSVCSSLKVVKKRCRSNGDMYFVCATPPERQTYFFDKITITRKRSNYSKDGEYFAISWPGLHKLNYSYGRALERHTGAPVTLQTQLYYPIPDYKQNFSSLIVFARKFYWIKRKFNKFLYSSGRLCDRSGVLVHPFDSTDVDDYFTLNESVSVLMGAVVEGVRQTGNEIEYTNISGNNKIVKTKTFALAIKPMVFIAIEQ